MSGYVLGTPHKDAFQAPLGQTPIGFKIKASEWTQQEPRPTWPNALVLLAGVVLTPGRGTVTAALRILGREGDPRFCAVHRILSRAAWSSRAAASRLLLLLICSFLPAAAPVVIEFDHTIERRWGPKIRARGIYRDAVRSSNGHFVKASGLRWFSAMLLV